jgi:hypothetical protein
MPTAIRISTPISAPDLSTKSNDVSKKLDDVSRKSDHNQFVSVALFCGIGLLISLVAVLFGIQGVWF